MRIQRTLINFKEKKDEHLVSGKNAFLDNYLVLQKYISAVLKVYDNTDIIVYRKSV